MMKGRNGVLILMTGLLLSLPVHARHDDPRWFDDRLDLQESVIQRGIDRGTLTRREVRQIRSEQDEARRYLHDLRRDGYPPHEVKNRTERQLDRVDRHIRDLTQNSDVAPRYDGGRPPPPPPRY